MATGEAKRQHAKTGRQVCFVHPRGHVQWSEVFDNNPKIAKARGRDVIEIVQGGGLRPYILAKQFRRWTWRRYVPEPGEFFFTPDEEKFGRQVRGAILIEPHVKAVGHSNKRYAWESWLEVAAGLKDQWLIQMGGPGTQVLPGCELLVTASFRQAAVALKHCRAAVMSEGGLMHAAAAVGTRSVILWSEFIAPENTGYKMHENIRHAGPACGSRLDCAGCRKSLEAITPTEILERLGKIL